MKKAIELVLEKKVEVYRLQNEIRQMESELVKSVDSDCISINWKRLTRRYCVEPLRSRYRRA